MKHVILFIDNLGSGGAQRQLVNMGILLKARGYRVTMLVYGDVPFYRHLLDENGIPVTLIQAKGYASRMVRVRRYLRRSDADAVIAFLETPGFIACFSKIGGAKWKLITNELSAKASTFSSKKNRIYNRFERYADAKVCNSENAMGMWLSHYPQYKDKYRVIYNPVIMPPSTEATPVPERGDGKLRLTVAASYQELKNPLRVVEAVSQLSEEHKARLDLQWYGRAEATTGNTEIYDQAVAMVQAWGLRGCVTLNHETKDIYRHMAESDAVGLFSTVEGLPNAICEGMMLGKPIVMSRVSDHTVLTEGNGLTCDPTSVDSIREALEAFLNTTVEERMAMGQRSKEKAARLFDKDAVIDQWVTLLESLTENSAAEKGGGYE